MNKLSVVIITYNEEKNIVDCIRSAKTISDDIIVVDCGSNDGTLALARQEDARTILTEWNGYGSSRNLGALHARHDWIFSLDADERISKDLAVSTKSLTLNNKNHIYKFRRENYLSQKRIRFGTLGFETITRIYHRDNAKWDLTPVHEKLNYQQASIIKIQGQLLHFGLKNSRDYKTKADWYAQMSARKYLGQGRKIMPLKKIFSPLFNSIKSYIFQLGFLDGWEGLIVAKTIAYYSWLKYFYLEQLLKEEKVSSKDSSKDLHPAPIRFSFLKK
jgi:glycosyltransferase involved in cell wall biosynthesis